ncbi:MAG: Nramp family divalent metal transporter [Bacteroidales bacterium]|nr:Nramp family divalent metal transporter [Bacteroidales bacterium]
MSRFKRLIISVLPGIFLIGYNIGTGSITAMSKAGASFGTSLLWTILLSCIITFYLLDRFSFYTIVTGETFINGIKKHIHPSVSWFLTAALVIIILAAILGLMGILSDTVYEGMAMFSSAEIPRIMITIVLGMPVIGILISGTNKTFENIMAIIVGIMGLAFIIAVIYLHPSFSSLAKGFIPSIPREAGGSDNSGFAVIAGMTGTTVSSVVFIIRSLLVKEAGWTLRDMKSQRIDAANSAFFMFLISAAVMIVAAETLFSEGIRVNNVPELLPILEPIAGRFAVVLMIIGIAAAGLSSLLPNILAMPWIVKDYRGNENPLKKPKNWIIFAFVLYCTLGTAFGIKPIFLMLLSQACLAVLLPVTTISMAVLLHSRNVMGDHRLKWVETIIWLVIIAYSILMSGLGMKGLILDLQNIFI